MTDPGPFLAGRGTALLLRGDSAEELARLPDESLDAVVCDPPAGISFMGKSWDAPGEGPSARDAFVRGLVGVFGPSLRVLRPGGRMVVWAIPRTSHWTATAIELAGFEVLGVLWHLFGSGFPKSHDASKAIDRKMGTLGDRRVVGRKDSGLDKGGRHSVDFRGSTGRDEGGLIPVTEPAHPEARRWAGWGTALKPAAEHWILAAKPPTGPRS